MTSVDIFFVLVWPCLVIGLAVASVLAFHWLLDRRERRHHAAE
jgi:hypothetical protein